MPPAHPPFTRRPTAGKGTRLGLALLLLAGQLVVAVGVPLPGGSAAKPAGSVPFPCQFRACGCQSSDECWAGDCCCFTLAEKVAWADAIGVEPPPHARSLANRSRPSPTPAASCCSADGGCCSQVEEQAPPAEPDRDGVRWVVGAWAKKCRGFGPDGVGDVDQFPPPDHAHAPAHRSRAAHPALQSETTVSASRRPDTPPPRSC